MKPNPAGFWLTDTRLCDKFARIVSWRDYLTGNAPQERLNRQPEGNDVYITDSGAELDVGELLDKLVFVCHGRIVTPLDIGKHLTQSQLDDWHNGDLSSSDLKLIADKLDGL